MKKIEISKIKIGVRIRKDNGNIQELSKSIDEFGLISPIIVRRQNDSYKLLAGYRRLQAIKMLKHTKIAAIIHEL